MSHPATTYTDEQVAAAYARLRQIRAASPMANVSLQQLLATE